MFHLCRITLNEFYIIFNSNYVTNNISEIYILSVLLFFIWRITVRWNLHILRPVFRIKIDEIYIHMLASTYIIYLSATPLNHPMNVSNWIKKRHFFKLLYFSLNISLKCEFLWQHFTIIAKYFCYEKLNYLYNIFIVIYLCFTIAGYSFF